MLVAVLYKTIAYRRGKPFGARSPGAKDCNGGWTHSGELVVSKAQREMAILLLLLQFHFGLTDTTRKILIPRSFAHDSGIDISLFFCSFLFNVCVFYFEAVGVRHHLR